MICNDDMNKGRRGHDSVVCVATVFSAVSSAVESFAGTIEFGCDRSLSIRRESDCDLDPY